MPSRQVSSWAWWISSITALLLIVPLTIAQPPQKTPPEKTPPAEKRRVKEEEDTKPDAKKDEPPFQKANPPEVKPAPKEQSISTGPFNLGEEAKQAKHSEIKKLLEELATPMDLVTSDSGKVYKTTPIPKKVDLQDTNSLSFKTLDGQPLTLPRPQIKDVSQYEIRALNAVRQFLDRRLDTAQPPVSRFQQLRAAEMVLTEVGSFHKAALSQNTRDPRSWAGTQDELVSRLFAIRIDELRALQAGRDYLTGDALAAKLFHDAPGNRVLLDAIEQYYVKQAEEFLNENRNLEGRLKLEVLRDKFRNPLISTLSRRVVERLEDFARKHLDAAKQAVDAKDRSKALASLEDAEAAWPTFPGLRELREQLLGEYPVLRIGVRTLPHNVSPMTAMTDVDKIAGQLLFEPLLVARAAPSSADGFRTILTETPRRLVNGYEFVLPSSLTWSDGQPVKTDDVLRSLELVTTPGTPLFDPTKSNNAVFTARALDESRIAFTFNSAQLDPLAQLSFPILPAHRLPRERSPLDPAFDKQPVGTGPFVLAGMEGEEVIFRANPNFKRPQAPTGPHIKEIRFIRYTDWNVAKRAFLDGRWQMLIEASSKEVEDLTGQPQSMIFTPTEPKSTILTNPRIYFLAINHRKPYLQNVKLREAIYFAIDRKRILDTVFRGKNQNQHQVLNGPYPLNSWAYDMSTYNPAQKSPFDAFKASAARNNAGTIPALKLVVLAEDGPGQAACALMKEDLAKTNIQVAITPMSGNALFLELNKEQPDFDLLYTSYDFDNESLNIQPLLDSEASNGKGRNYMGYQLQQPDNQLMQLLRASQTSRDFNTVQRQMFAIHDHIIKNFILVPLWQLDRHVAVHRSLDNYNRFHPLYVFDGTENWTLKASK